MAGIPSHYSINIARLADTIAGPCYLHHARLELPPSVCLVGALDMLDDTMERYPAPAFKVEMAYWSCSGHRIPSRSEAALVAHIVRDVVE